MLYAKIENNEIVRNNIRLPFSTGTTSFGKNTSTDTMISHGYYPIMDNPPVLEENEVISGITYNIGVNKVTKVYSTRTLTEEEIRKAKVPKSVTMRQARLALLAINKLDSVQSGIDMLPEPQKTEAQIEWDYSSEVLRDKPFVLQITSTLGMTEEEVDNLFIEAGKL